MRVAVTTVLHDLDGLPLIDAAVEREGVIVRPARPFTLRKACTEVLNNALPKDEPDGEEKHKRFRLSMLINGADEPDLTVEQIALLKRLIALGFVGLVVGRCYEILDPTPSAETPPK